MSKDTSSILTFFLLLPLLFTFKLLGHEKYSIHTKKYSLYIDKNKLFLFNNGKKNLSIENGTGIITFVYHLRP